MCAISKAACSATALATGLLGERLAPTALVGGLLMLGAVAGLYLRRMGDSNSRGLAPNPLSNYARAGERGQLRLELRLTG